MATDTRYIDILLKVAADQGATVAAIAQLNAVKDGLDEVKKGAGTTAPEITAFQAAVDAVKSNPEIKQLATDLDAATKAAKEAEDQIGQIGSDSGGGLGNATYGAARGARAAGQLATMAGAPGLGQAFTVGADLAYVQNGISKLGDALTGLPGILGDAATEGLALGGSLGSVLAVAGPVAIAVGIIAAGLSAFNKELTDMKVNLQSAVDQTNKFYDDLIGGMTTDDAKKKVAQLTSVAVPARETEVKQAQGAVDSFRTQAQENVLNGLLPEQAKLMAVEALQNDDILKKLPGADILFKNLDDANKKLDDANNAVGSFTGAIKNNSFAANDAAEMLKAAADAEQKAQDQLNAAALKGINQKVANAKTEASLLDGTSDAAKKRVDALEGENAEIRDILPELEARAKSDQNAQVALDAYNETLKNNIQLITDINSAILPAIISRENEAATIKAQTENEKALTAERLKEQNAVASIEQTMANMRAAQAYTVQQQELQDQQAADANAARVAEVTKKAQEADANALQTYNNNVAKSNATFDDSQLKASQDFQKRYLRDQQDLETSLNDLAGQRDVAGFIKAQRDGELKLSREEQDFKDSQAQAKRDHQTTLNDMAKAYADQKRQRDQATQDSLAQQRSANTARQQLEIDDYNRRYAAEDAKLTEAKNRLDTFWNDFVSAIPTPGSVQAPAPSWNGGPVGSDTIVSVIPQAPYDPLTAGWSTNTSGFDSGGFGGGISSDILQGIPQYAGGLDFAATRHMAIIDQGEGVLTAQENMARKAGGGVTVNIYNTVGDIATQSMLKDSIHQMASAVKGAIKQVANGG